MLASLTMDVCDFCGSVCLTFFSVFCKFTENVTHTKEVFIAPDQRSIFVDESPLKNVGGKAISYKL